jgi:hypothetical protein
VTAPGSPAASRVAVNVAGFLKGGLGLGEAARRYVAALQAGGVPVSTTAYDVPLPTVQAATPKEFEFVDVAGSVEPAFNLVCVNAPELPAFYSEVGPAFFGDRRTIGVWAWEVDKVPRDWTWAFDVVDEIWVYSHYVADILRPVSPVPVIRMPLPVPKPVVPPADAAPGLGLDGRFTFLFLFDFFSTTSRSGSSACSRQPRATRTCTWWTATCRPPSATPCSPRVTVTSRCTARRASA